MRDYQLIAKCIFPIELDKLLLLIGTLRYFVYQRPFIVELFNRIGVFLQYLLQKSLRRALCLVWKDCSVQIPPRKKPFDKYILHDIYWLEGVQLFNPDYGTCTLG